MHKKVRRITFFQYFFSLFTRSVTVMVVPGVNQPIKQLRIYKLLVYALVALTLSASLYLILLSISLMEDNNWLSSQSRAQIEENLSLHQEYDQLKEANNELFLSVTDLENELYTTHATYELRMSEVAALENQLNALIGMIDDEHNTQLLLGFSRSFDNSTDLNLSPLIPYKTVDDKGEMANQDVITTAISQKIQAYQSLSASMTDTIELIEATPDAMPAKGELTSPFGYRRDPITRRQSFHKGIDIATSYGAPIQAAGSGIVTFSGWSGSYGRVLVISHGHGYESVYAHCAKIMVSEGDRIDKGQLIAKVGTSGKSTGPHLHFEIHILEEAVDPLTILKSTN